MLEIVAEPVIPFQVPEVRPTEMEADAFGNLTHCVKRLFVLLRAVDELEGGEAESVEVTVTFKVSAVEATRCVRMCPPLPPDDMVPDACWHMRR